MTQRSKPALIATDGTVRKLSRFSMDVASVQGGLEEAWVQSFLLEHPDVLPCEEVDRAFTNLVPLCREMRTTAGPIDLVFVTPEGKLALVETKLWRNPQARREVVAQILDYAKELSRWDFDDLERQVIGASGGDKRPIYERVRARFSAIPEIDFCDQVSRCLRTGQFLLLIVGDGIREGVAAMADFLDQYGSLQFSFGLIELGLFDDAMAGRLVVPTVVAKTVIMKRTIVAVEALGDARILDGRPDTSEQPIGTMDPAQEERNRFLMSFWRRLLDDLHLDDASQPRPKPTSNTNIFFSMPPSGSEAWVSAYFAQSRKQAGVYLTFTRNSQIGEAALTALQAEKYAINSELGVEAEWIVENGRLSIFSKTNYDDLSSPAAVDTLRQFFQSRINRYVSTFRPRLERLAESL